MAKVEIVVRHLESGQIGRMTIDDTEQEVDARMLRAGGYVPAESHKSALERLYAGMRQRPSSSTPVTFPR